MSSLSSVSNNIQAPVIFTGVVTGVTEATAKTSKSVFAKIAKFFIHLAASLKGRIFNEMTFEVPMGENQGIKKLIQKISKTYDGVAGLNYSMHKKRDDLCLQLIRAVAGYKLSYAEAIVKLREMFEEEMKGKEANPSVTDYADSWEPQAAVAFEYFFEQLMIQQSSDNLYSALELLKSKDVRAVLGEEIVDGKLAEVREAIKNEYLAEQERELARIKAEFLQAQEEAEVVKEHLAQQENDQLSAEDLHAQWRKEEAIRHFNLELMNQEAGKIAADREMRIRSARDGVNQAIADCKALREHYNSTLQLFSPSASAHLVREAFFLTGRG